MTEDAGPPLDEDLSITELGQDFGRGFAEANATMFEAVLLGAADRLLQEMAEVGEDEEIARAAVDVFRTAARAEWARVSAALRTATPGNA